MYYEITIQNGTEIAVLHTKNPNGTQRILSGTLKESVGQTPSLTFTITPHNLCYDRLHDRQTRVTLTNTATGETEFEGYVLTTASQMTSTGSVQKKVVCEGLLGCLCDSVQLYHHYENATPAQFLNAVLAQHNAQVSPEKQIHLGLCNVTGNTNSKTTAYRSTLGEIRENLVSRLGGALRVRRVKSTLVLDYLDTISSGHPIELVVQLAENLRSISVETDSADIITRLIPLGCSVKDDTAERLTIEGAVVDGKPIDVPYIDDPAAMERYGIICGTVTFDDITVKENLYARGKEYLAAHNREKRHYAASVLDVTGHGALRIGDTYRFRCDFLGLDENLRLLGRTVDLLSPHKPQVEIGDKTAKLTDVTTSTRKLVAYEIPQKISQTISSAKQIASQLITAATTGFVVVRPNEILIMDTDDVNTATSVWRMNQGGIGYSHSDTPGEAYGGTYGLAMTMNGQIVADFIAAGTMYADRIRGGTLKLGGSDGMDGVMQVLDENGTEICRLDKNGAYIFGTVVTQNASGYWLSLSDGNLMGGKGEQTYTTLNATGHITDGDHGITYNGLSITADAIDLNCTMFSINRAIGTTGNLDFVAGVTVQTDTVPLVTGVRLENGELIVDTKDFQYVSSVSVADGTTFFRSGIMCTELRTV